MHFNNEEVEDNKIEAYHSHANTIELKQDALLFLSEKICNDPNCRYPQLSLRILMYMIAGTDMDGRIYVNARHIAKMMNVNYDTVTKCLKYLRSIEAINL